MPRSSSSFYGFQWSCILSVCPFMHWPGGHYTQAKARRNSDAPSQWYTLYVSSFYHSCWTSKFRRTCSSAEWSVLLVISPFVSLMIGQVIHLAAEAINMTTTILLNGLSYSCYASVGGALEAYGCHHVCLCVIFHFVFLHNCWKPGAENCIAGITWYFL